MHYINHNIRFFREHKRYTQNDIAGMLNTTLGRIKQYEKVTYPPAEMVMAIADMMGISLDTLFRVKLNPKNYKPVTVEDESRIAEIERKLNQFLLDSRANVKAKRVPRKKVSK